MSTMQEAEEEENKDEAELMELEDDTKETAMVVLSPPILNNNESDENIEDIQSFLNRLNLENETKDKLIAKQIDYKTLISRRRNPMSAVKLQNQYKITKEEDRRKIMEEIYKIHQAKEAWLSIETTIEEINVNQQYFVVGGWFTVFWKDSQFDKNKILDSLSENKKYSIVLIKKLLNGDEITVDEAKQMETEENEADLFRIWTKKGRNTTQKYIAMKDCIDLFKQKYGMPFYSKSGDKNDDETFTLFANTIDFELIGTNPVDMVYNLNECAFEMHIVFRAKLYECFENNDDDFPFEWQFLNMQIVYDINKYHFAARVPEFVERGFCFSEFWEHAEAIWKHSVLTRKRANIEEWKLLNPWVDLRKVRNDYDYDFYFGLIKLRVCRNPTYYMLYIIIPLFLMGLCAFAVFIIDYDESIGDRLSYIVALLLTVAAFQLSISTDLPYQSQFTLIDQYFLLQYFILTLLVLESALIQSAWRWNIDEFKLELCSCIILGALWLIHFFNFVFKYFTYSVNEGSWCGFFEGILLFFGWGSIKSFALCTCVISSCCDCCKDTKRKKRLKHWMKMEKTEASSWDNTRKLESISKKAELVLGTRGDIYVWNEGINHDYQQRKIYRKWWQSVDKTKCIDLQLRYDIISELLEEEKKDQVVRDCNNCCCKTNIGGNATNLVEYTSVNQQSAVV